MRQLQRKATKHPSSKYLRAKNSDLFENSTPPPHQFRKKKTRHCTAILIAQICGDVFLRTAKPSQRHAVFALMYVRTAWAGIWFARIRSHGSLLRSSTPATRE